MMNKSSKRKEDSFYTAVGKGLIIALLICFAGAITGAFLLSNQMISEDSVFVATVFTWLIAAFGGSAVTASTAKMRYLISVLLTNICILFVLSGIGILFFESNFKCVLAAILAIIAGGVLTILIFLNKSPKKNKKFRYKV